MKIASLAHVVVAVALVAGGCARQPVAPASLKDTLPVKPAKDGLADWCGDRHVDHQEGKAPGGAATLEKKGEDDRTCAEVYRSLGYTRAK